MQIRAARASDSAEIEAIMAPAIAAGQLLPQSLPPPRRHVAVDADGRIIGAVSLKPWSGEVIELGGLVSVVTGRGVGRALVAAALRDAAAAQYDTVVALTAIPDFFARQGFRVHDNAPWRWARETPLRVPDDGLGLGMLLKSTCCSGCPRLARCNQILMVRQIEKVLVA